MAQRTVHLAQPVILRLRVADPTGQQPTDLTGQPLRGPDGEALSPFKVAEHHFRKGPNLMDEELARHPYIVAHSIDASDAGPAYTVTQLEAMLADARAREAGGAVKPGEATQGAFRAPPWPSDDEIQALDFKGLGDLLTLHQIDLTGLKSLDKRLEAVINAKAKDAETTA